MKHLLPVAALAVFATACATTPVDEPAPVDTRPVVQQPTETQPVTPPRTVTPIVPQGPSYMPGSQEDLTVNAGDKVFFAYDSFSLTDTARATLDLQAAWLNTYSDAKILIAGNTDERGTREYNFALGARRAEAAKDYLISRGISADRIRTISYGKERPVDPRSEPDAWSVNRNSTTTVIEPSMG